MLLLPAKHRPKPHDAHEKSVGWIFGGLKEGGTPSKRASQAAPRPDPLKIPSLYHRPHSFSFPTRRQNS